MTTISPTLEQEHAIAMTLSGHNVFLTGYAGSGKSAVLDILRQFLGRKAVFLAPTGLAALKIQGSTLHRFFNLPSGILFQGLIDAIIGEELIEKIRRVEVFIIDEVSMLRSDIFVAIDAMCRYAATTQDEAYLPFGGKQIIVTGDFAQLSPIVNDYFERETLNAIYGGEYAFETPQWRQANFSTVRLTKVWRQSTDILFVDLLRALRNVSNNAEAAIVARQINDSVRVGAPPPDATVLCPKKDQVQWINQVRDEAITGQSWAFQGRKWKNFNEDLLATPMHLRLKIGSRVMVTANQYAPLQTSACMNGQTGLLVGVDPGLRFVEVLLDDGRREKIGWHHWMNYDYCLRENAETGEYTLDLSLVGTFKQIPLTLAYAMTIHKSQGLTLPSVHIELGPKGMFAAGQLYTALSRARSLDGLSLSRPLRADDVLFDPRVVAFCKMVDGSPPPPMLDEPGWSAFPLILANTAECSS